MGKRLVGWLLMLALLVPALPAAAEGPDASAELYVSPSGSDETGDGTLSSPFRTVGKARDAVRERIAGGMASDLTVYLRGGVYPIDGPIRFDERDSGRDGYKVVYTNYPGEQPVISGGERVEGWQPHDGNIYKAAVGTAWTFNELFENDVRSVLARHPNEDYNRVSGMVPADAYNKFRFRQGDIPVVADQSQLLINIWPGGPDGEWNWFNINKKLDGIDYATRTVSIRQLNFYPLGVGSRYYIAGAIELLDQPGEFYLDKQAGMLYYWPKSLPIEQQVIVAPRTKTLVEFKGTSTATPVRHIEMRGIAFKFSDSDEEMGYEALRSGIHLENAEHIAIKNSLIEHIGGNGIKLHNYAKNNTIYGNRIRETGHTGIVLKYSGPATSQYWNYGNAVSNNEIYLTGRTIKGAMGIDMYESGGNTVSHNLIYETPGTAINLKGHASYAERVGKTIDGIPVTGDNYKDFTATRYNRIEFNDLTVSSRQTQDDGFIHTFWIGPGNAFHNNIFHDSTVHYSFGEGIYVDDESEGTIITSNVIYNLASGDGKMESPIFAKSQDLVIRNNIIANNARIRSADISLIHNASGGALETKRATVENNITYHSSRQVYATNAWSEELIGSSDGNVFYHPSGEYHFSGYPVNDLAEWKSLYAEHDQYTVTADPLFVDPANHDYRLKPNSPALARGFEPIDLASVGLKADFPFSDPNDPLAKVFVAVGAEDTAVRLSTGELARLAVTARSAKGYPVTLADANVTFRSSDKKVAAVDADGVVTGGRAGSAVVTVTVSRGGVEKSTPFYIQVEDAFGRFEFLEGTRTVYAVGETYALKAAAATASGGFLPLSLGTVAYASSDPSVVAIDDSGVVTAVGAGTATIAAEATIDGVTKTAAMVIEVYDAILDRVSPSIGDATLDIGQQTSIEVAATMTNGAPIAPGEATIAFVSENPSVVAVDANGIATAVAPGTTRVKVTVAHRGVVKSMAVPVGVLTDIAGVSVAPPWQVSSYRYGSSTSSAEVAMEGGEIRIQSSGATVWGAFDDLTYVWQEIPYAEKVTMTATLSRFAAEDPAAVAGLMFRSADAQVSDNVTLRIHARAETAVSTRQGTKDGYVTGFSKLPLNRQGLTVKLERDGTNVRAYYQEDGQWYIFADLHNIELGTSMLAGLVVSGDEGPDDFVEAVFTNVTIEAQDPPPPYARLVGTPFGTNPGGQPAGGQRHRAFDGDPSSFFVGDYTGIDLGADGASVVNLVRFLPRSGFAANMAGGVFQGSNTSAEDGYEDLYVIPDSVVEGWNEAALPDGAPAYRYLRYVGPDGSLSNVAEIEFYRSNLPETDTEPPSAPANVAAEGITDTSISLRWTASSDNDEVAGYDVYANGQKANDELLSDTAYMVAGLTENTEYVFTVKAKDASGNESEFSAPLVAKTKAAVVRTELLANGGFETGDLTGWGNWGNARVVGASAYEGTYAAQVGTAAGGFAQEIRAGFGPGHIVRLSAAALVDAAAGTVSVAVKFKNASNQDVGPGAELVFSGAAYTTKSIDAAVPVGTAYIQVYVWKNAASGYLHVDNLSLLNLTPPDQQPEFIDLMANGGFESGTLSGWGNWGNAQVVNEGAFEGTHAAKVGASGGGFAQEIRTGFAAGDTVRLEAAALADASAGFVSVGLKFKNASNQDVTSGAELLFSQPEYGEKSVELTVPEGTAYIQVYVWKNASSGYAYADGFKLLKRI
ncbi:right-handed parallel beta-helix repeat-containing protein [Paenibacillus sp.]|uniref:right-handed parallel beta-helix repeat-containing protein n=1 Tax=Paenibacillus sp. TaxID=58172 RepID=UPI002D681734|nr:right-handed parallel beta-helix repeat-containing protein [Paenibacillus sp.]HZG55637.1 right-handed parallel beta-helix repeat-containing protein [Paenibacillus sp.]